MPKKGAIKKGIDLMNSKEVLLINPFEVSSSVGSDFVDQWKTVTDQNDLTGKLRFAHLHQAIDPDTPIGFVNRAAWASAEVFAQTISEIVAGDSGEGLRDKASPSLYRVAFSEGLDPSEAPVLLLNFWEATHEAASDAQAFWKRGSDKIVKADGFMGVRFHEALDPENVKYRWVNYAGWESEGAFRSAMKCTEASMPNPPGVKWHPALYKIAERVVP